MTAIVLLLALLRVRHRRKCYSCSWRGTKHGYHMVISDSVLDDHYQMQRYLRRHPRRAMKEAR